MNNTGRIALLLLAMGWAQGGWAGAELSGVLQAQLVSLKSDLAPDGSYLSDGGRAGQADGNGGNSGTVTFSGVQMLGDGMRAVARYSINVESDSGLQNGPRESYLGLDGEFGTLLLGTLATPYKEATAHWDPFYGTFMQARGNGGTAAAFGDGTRAGDEVAGDEGYMGNALYYRFKLPRTEVALMLAPDESSDGAADPATNGNDASSASITVNFDHVELALAYLGVDDYGQDTSAVGYLPLERSNAKVGVRLHNDGFSLGLQWIASDKDYDDGDYALLTTSYRSGNNTYALNYGRFADADSANSGTTEDMNYLALGLRHDFSREVSLFLGYRSTKVESSAASDLSESVYGAGLRVGF